MDESGVKVTATGISDGFLEPEISLNFENHTDLPLTFSAKRASVNGYMMNLLMIAEVAAGKRARETIDLMDSELEICGIDTVAEYSNLDDVSVNDSMIEAYYGQEITSGKRSLRPVYCSSTDLEKNGIEKMEKVEFVVTGDNLKTWETVFETVFETDPIVVEFK